MTPSTQAAFLGLTQCTSDDESALGKLKGGQKVWLPFSLSLDSNSKVQNSYTTAETPSPLPPHISSVWKPVLTQNNLSHQESCRDWEVDPLAPYGGGSTLRLSAGSSDFWSKQHTYPLLQKRGLQHDLPLNCCLERTQSISDIRPAQLEKGRHEFVTKTCHSCHFTTVIQWAESHFQCGQILRNSVLCKHLSLPADSTYWSSNSILPPTSPWYHLTGSQKTEWGNWASQAKDKKNKTKPGF